MKILLLNGSPRKNSNTMVITEAFIRGLLRKENSEVKRYDLSDCDIRPCLGCYSCWGKNAGKCVINDDMSDIRQDILLSDIIIESFPLYFFGMPSQMKAFTDRLLPFTMQYVGGDNFHELRYNELFSKKLVVISSCGYSEADEMYLALKKQYDMICGEGGYTSIFSGEGEILGLGTKRPQMRYYLGNIEKAGEEFAEKLSLSEETKTILSEPIVPKALFEAVARAHWSEFRNDENKKPLGV
ncbi:MAG: flavodoxin family protein [Ruminiclostridium sp.]